MLLYVQTYLDNPYKAKMMISMQCCVHAKNICGKLNQGIAFTAWIKMSQIKIHITSKILNQFSNKSRFMEK